MRYARGRITDPTPITPTVESIDTSLLPKYATTADEYWQIVDCIWPAILDIFKRVDMQSDISTLETMKLNRDREISNLFNQAWRNAPDEYFIHTWPQWGRFCDLCSECGVLYDGEQD